MKARVKDAAEAGTLNLQRCKELANQELFLEAGVTARAIVAFARKNGLAYESGAVGSSNSGSGEQPNRVRQGAAKTAVSRSGGFPNLMPWIWTVTIVLLIYALVFGPDNDGSTGGGGACRAKLDRCLESEPESRWETSCQPEYYRCIS